jgi:hypothetical protein
MSDNWILLIPEDPSFVPEKAKQSLAGDRFSQLAPNADKIEIQIRDRIEFVHAGGNFERILCPACRSDIPIRWWQDRMDEDYSNGFILSKHASPCCGAIQTLQDLVYVPPQGFGRFTLGAMNPNIGKLDDRYKKEFEEILGTELRVIYRHL